MYDVVAQENLDKMDKDKDGRVSLQEYLGTLSVCVLFFFCFFLQETKMSKLNNYKNDRHVFLKNSEKLKAPQLSNAKVLLFEYGHMVVNIWKTELLKHAENCIFQASRDLFFLEVGIPLDSLGVRDRHVNILF